ncbi:MAG: hypothetical protein CBB97_08100 [Candidatus Endolissoclinum sp. TMED37]|nr:MAG: hypothetical protein CBB97_08100 [Candidatus Endolissoclinum sp. TMED37]|tara:strand:+ start:437 stop:1570 length:1134 start_codon:yes stop_codon:yes gene_type:complete
MKKIIIISHEYLPVRSGGVVLLNELIKYLLKKKFKIKLITSKYAKNIQLKKNKNLEVIRVNCLADNLGSSRLISLILFFFNGLFKLIKMDKNGYERVFSLFIVPSGLIGFIASLLFGYKSYIFVGGADLYTTRSKFSKILLILKPFTKFIVKKANKVFVAEGLENEYKRIYELNDFIKIRNGSLTKFKFNQLQNKKENYNFLIVGRLVERKGFFIILRAMTLLEHKYLNKITFTIIGNGPELKKINDFIINYNLQNYVKIIKGVNHKDLKKYYMKSDIYFFPSFPEGNSLALIEAMSYNLPIVISNEKGNVELFDNNGWLIDIRDKVKVHERMKEIIMEILNSSSKRLKTLGNHSKKISLKYDWSEILPIYEKEISK